MRNALGLARLALLAFYLAGPLLIVGELFKLELSIPIILLFAAWFLPLARSAAGHDKISLNSFDVTVCLCLLSLCVVWVYFSGIGSYAFCRWDYAKHNLIFANLLEHRLPIETEFEGRRFILHYNFAFYIFPVRLQQWLRSLGLDVGLNPILLLTYSAVLFLSVWVLARGKPVAAFVLSLVLMFVGGLDLAGMAAFNVGYQIIAGVPAPGLGIPWNIEWWGVPGAPQSLTMHLYYAPQHFFAALVGTALIFSLLRSSRPAAFVLFDSLIVVAASMFWSAYVAIGLMVVVVIKFLLDGGGLWLRRLRQEGLAPLVRPVGILSCAFALSLTLAAAAFVTAAVPLSPPSLLVSPSNGLAWLLTYAINYAPFILTLVLTRYPGAWRDAGGDDLKSRRETSLTIVAYLVASAAILLVRHGLFNDWGMRTTLPPLVALSLALTDVLLGHLRRLYLALLLAVLAASTASSLAELAIGVFIKPNCSPYGAFTLEDMGGLVSQYEGRPDSILYRYLVPPR